MNIVVENLAKRFNREWIFKNLNYSFQTGTTYAITGPNGSGKSTLLQVLWGQLPATSGKICYQKNSKNIEVEEIYKHLSIATPYLELIEEFTLEEQLKFHLNFKELREGLNLESVIDKMELSHARHKLISNFSSGMRQRVKLAMAFYVKAEIIFLDEPSTNLDAQAITWYLKNVHEIAGNSLIIIASNIEQEYPKEALKINLSHFK